MELKQLIWVASSLKDLRAFPQEVQRVMGFALYEAQVGDKHAAAKPFKGFKGAGVLEVVEDHDGDTFRTVYTVRFDDAVYVLHAFQKKSKRGVSTPKHDVDLIHARFEMARQLHEERKGPKKGMSK
jgi:phage-related protein